jgi:hypothetical protein
MPSAASIVSEQPAAPAAEAAAKPKAAPSLAERNADYNKRAKEKAEREQKDQEEQQAQADTAENCNRARSTRLTLDSGARIGQTESNGERGFMSDEQRAATSKLVDKVLAGCK